MKASDKPQISKKWWTSEKPRDVQGAEVEKAIQTAEDQIARILQHLVETLQDGAVFDPHRKQGWDQTRNQPFEFNFGEFVKHLPRG
jgi:hypothetical protein